MTKEQMYSEAFERVRKLRKLEGQQRPLIRRSALISLPALYQGDMSAGCSVLAMMGSLHGYNSEQP